MERALESRLDQIVRRQAELREALAAAGLSGADFAKLSKEYSELEPIVGGIEALRRAQEELSAATEMAEGGDNRELRPSRRRKSRPSASGCRTSSCRSNCR